MKVLRIGNRRSVKPGQQAAATACDSHLLFFEFCNVSHQLLFVRQATEVETDHFAGSLGRLTTGPQSDQHAGDDRAVRLKLDAVLVVAEQMPTPRHVFEKPKETLNRPAFGVNQSNRLGRNIEQVGGDTKDAVAVDATGTPASCVGIGSDTDHANRVIQLTARLTVWKRNHFVTDDCAPSGVLVTLLLLDGVPDTVVSQTAHKAAVGVDILLNNRNFA